MNKIIDATFWIGQSCLALLQHSYLMPLTSSSYVINPFSPSLLRHQSFLPILPTSSILPPHPSYVMNSSFPSLLRHHSYLNLSRQFMEAYTKAVHNRLAQVDATSVRVFEALFQNNNNNNNSNINKTNNINSYANNSNNNIYNGAYKQSNSNDSKRESEVQELWRESEAVKRDLAVLIKKG